MAIITLVNSGMEVMAEVADYGATITFKRQQSRRFKPGMAFSTITGCRECNLAIVTRTTGFSFEHVFHGRFADNRFVGIYFGMAIFTSICLSVELVAECR